MSTEERPRHRLVLGRNFIESMILTLLAIEFSSPPTLEQQEAIARRMETEVAAIATWIPSAQAEYVNNVIKILRREFPMLRPPEREFRKKLYLFDEVFNWIMRNLHNILGDQVRVMHPRDKERFAKIKTITIIRTAVQATLYKMGFLTV